MSAGCAARCRLGRATRASVVDTLTHPAWTRNADIYEVNVRQFSPDGTLKGVQAHLPRLKALGVDIIWLMPVQPIGRKNRKGPLGSYYSIADYTAINPELGTMADFDALVAAAHREGIKVLLDWVPNHTAFDHPWTTAHKAYYVTRADGTIINARDNEGHDTDWTDVAELNYDNPELRTAMIDAMRWWLVNGKIDGFRCDVAGGVPLDFWLQARAALQKTKPDLFMLAEAEDPKLHAAFDMTYGWEMHHLMNEVAQGKKPTGAFDAYFARQDSLFGRGAYRMYFTSNHDENSWNGSEFERMGANALPMYVLAATIRGRCRCSTPDRKSHSGSASASSRRTRWIGAARRSPRSITRCSTSSITSPRWRTVRSAGPRRRSARLAAIASTPSSARRGRTSSSSR